MCMVKALFLTKKLIKMDRQSAARYFLLCFPFEALYKWLSASDKSMQRREVTLVTHNNRFYRNNRYASLKEFREDVLKNTPYNIYVGGVYDTKELSNVRAREIIFDIDLTDYSDVRTCCRDERRVCNVCGTLLVVAIQILDWIFRKTFGFKHIVWMFSGCRGVHAWICDPRACVKSAEYREAVLDYIADIASGDCSGTFGVFEHVRRVLDEHFMTMLTKFKWLDTEAGVQLFLSKIPDVTLKVAVADAFKNTPERTSEMRWSAFLRTNDWFVKNGGFKTDIVRVIQLFYCFPRLDMNVTKDRGHLLRCPFSVHERTDKICAPIDLSCLIILDWEQDFLTTAQSVHDGRIRFDLQLEYFGAFIDDLLSDESNDELNGLAVLLEKNVLRAGS